LGVGIAVWLLVVGAALVLTSYGAWSRSRRAASLERLAGALGLGYAATDVFNERWEPFRLFALGQTRGIENVLYGRFQGAEVRGFDYWYREGGGEDEPKRRAPEAPPLGLAGRIGLTRRFSCAVGGVPASCPKLVVAPRRFRDRVTMGTPVPVESERFMRRFHVRCEDPRFAVAFLDPRVMDALLGLPKPTTLALSEDRLLLVSRRLLPTQVIRLVHEASALVRAAPRVVASFYPLRPGFRPGDEREPAPTVRSAVDDIFLSRPDPVAEVEPEVQ
jgi:hypothetical protein